MIEIRASRQWSIEVDAIYKRMGYDLTTKQSGVYYVDTRATANSWEFPVVGQFRVGYPYVSNLPVPFEAGHFDARSHHGGVVMGGIEKRFGRLRVAPEIRYTRWAVDDPAVGFRF